ncbi:adenylate kinase [Streptomyces sp. NRRL F-5755]|uniref:adenylate kinase n=1 Tax=Streptomyces sp. NRRL F-5755 TaxID=1519475 RepID=UPI0006AF5E3A|nr:adenylate kinase [Streptomyces sp. NRRL F-5755]KOT90391.1 adenylate kinase [Streptomyces sp. NRRL F-5755]
MKITVFGLPGTGKSTLARSLSARTGIPAISLDAILFSPGGPLPLEEFRAEAGRVTAGRSWIVEGNYSKLADVVWHRADTLVWLDYCLPVIAWRITARFLRQAAGREANPNRLTFRRTFTARTSVLRNAVRKYRKNRPRYTRQTAEASAHGVLVLRLRSPRQTRCWLHSQPVAAEDQPVRNT